MKIATHVLLFNQDKWILKNIENSGPFVDKIYVSWSEYPWNYNKNARKQFKNKSDLSILDKSPYRDKIEIIKGVWDLDEDQRNACAIEAKKDGMDYLLVHDADEFYTQSDFEKIINGIKKEPDYDFYKTPWITFWKDFEHVIADKNGRIIGGHPEVAINLNRGIRFTRCRRPSGNTSKVLGALCHHASYVLTDEECWSKINTWGHAHQFNTKKWFDEKWVNWTEQTTHLHPISPIEWYCTVKFNTGKLPEVLKNNL